MAAPYRAEGQALRLLPPELVDQDPATTALQEVHLARNRLGLIPERLLEHAGLQCLDLADNDVRLVPHAIVRLAHLRELNLSVNLIDALPVELFQLRQLTSLNLSHNRLHAMPPYIGLLMALQSVDLSRNDLGSLPQEFALLTALTTLNLSHNRLSHLPLGHCPELQQLDVRGNLFGTLGDLASAAPHLATLDAARNQFYTFPAPLPVDLRLLDLSYNAIAAVPLGDLGALSRLERLYLDENRLTEVPAALEQLVNLVEFSFRGNRITSVSSVIENHPAALRAFEDNPHLGEPDAPLPPALPVGSLLRPKSMETLTQELATVAQHHARFEYELRLRQREQQVQRLEADRQRIEDIAKRVEALQAGGGVVGGGLSSSSRKMPDQSLDELKKEIEELQRIVFSDSAMPKEIDDANIKLEKAMAAFEKHPESKEAVRKAKEEQRARNDPLNKAALERLRAVLNPTTVRANPELLKRVGENAELRLLFMEPETILRLHPTDFKSYSLKNLTLEELRAVRAVLPKFRRDQHAQQEWTDNLDDKIETMTRAALSPPTPKRVARKIVLKRSAAAGAAGSGDVFAELLARKKAAAAGGAAGAVSPAAVIALKSQPISPRGAKPAPPTLPALPSVLPPSAPPPAVPNAAPTPALVVAVSAPLHAAPASPPLQLNLPGMATGPRPLSASAALSPQRMPVRPLSPTVAGHTGGATAGRSGSPMTIGKRSAAAALSSIADNMKAALDDDTPPMPMGSRSSTGAASAASAAVAAVAAAAGIPDAALLTQYEQVDAGLNRLLEYSNKGDADLAADTRATVAEVKKLAEMCKGHNSDAVQPLEASAADLVNAVKVLLVSRNPVARVSLGTSQMTTEQAKENLEDVVFAVREKSATAVMQQ